MDPLTELQKTLRAIEQGERLEAVNGVLLRQVLHQPVLAPSTTDKTATTTHSRGDNDPSHGTNDGPEDFYRALRAIRAQKKQQEVKSAHTENNKTQIQKTKSSPKKCLNDHQNDLRMPEQTLKDVLATKLQVDDTKSELILQAEMDSTTRKLYNQLQHSHNEVEVATATLHELLEASQALIPSEFLFERNLVSFCRERSLDAIKSVLLKFKHRFFSLYFQRWHDEILARRRQAHIHAANEIFRVYRGHQARKRACLLRKQLEEMKVQASKLLQLRIQYRIHQAIKIQMTWRRYLRHKSIQERQKQKMAAIRLQKAFQNKKFKANRLVHALMHTKSIMAVVTVQKTYRGHRARQFVREMVRKRKREALVTEILLRNSSKEALIAWKLQRRGAGFLISHCIIYPYVVRRRFQKWICLLRQQRAAKLIARQVCLWYGVEARRQAAVDNQLHKWFQLVGEEKRRSKDAALLIQKHLRRWVHQRKYQMGRTRQRKLEARQRQLQKAARTATHEHADPKSRAQLSGTAPRFISILQTNALKDNERKEQDAAQTIQCCYRRHCHYLHFIFSYWREQAKQVEIRLRQRQMAAIVIQKRFRGYQGRLVVRIRRAEKQLTTFIRKWKWRKILERTNAAKKIARWLKHKRVQYLASLWRLEKKKRNHMARKLQHWMRRKCVFPGRFVYILAQSRKIQETRLFCEQSLRVCTQHLTDKIIFDSISAGFEEALKAILSQPSKKEKRHLPRSVAFPILPMVFLVVSGLSDAAKWKEMDVKKLLQTKLERSKVVALFKAINKRAQAQTYRPGSPKAKQKSRGGEIISSHDVDLALAKVAGTSKRPIVFEEFILLLRQIAELRMTHISIWWSKYEGGDGQLLALLWKYIFPLPDIKSLVDQLATLVTDVMHKLCLRVQRLFHRQSNLIEGSLIRIKMQKQRQLEAKQQAIVGIQQHVRSFLAKQRYKALVQSTYEKYIDPEWGLPYWMNPKTGYSTWIKPAILHADDVNVEAVPFPPSDLILKAPCQGKSDCSRCAEWFCYECEQYFCRQCLPTFHKASKNGNLKDELDSTTTNQAHEMEYLVLCGLCEFQVASRKCIDCAVNPNQTKSSSSPLLRQSEVNTSFSTKLERECLYCDVCFAYIHRRGALQTHKPDILLEMCRSCIPDDSDTEVSKKLMTSSATQPRWSRAVQWECMTCDNQHLCGRCALSIHPVETCGKLKPVSLTTVSMQARAKRIQDEREAQERADVEKMKQKALRAKQERAAMKIQSYWKANIPMRRAKRLIDQLKLDKHDQWLQKQQDAKKQKQLAFMARNFLGIAKPLATDSEVQQKLRQMNALQRRHLTIRARMFGLLLQEYMRVGIPLPGIGRMQHGSNELVTTEDLRGWVKNRQTIRLKRIESPDAGTGTSTRKRKPLPSAWQVLARWRDDIDSILMDVDPKKSIGEHMIPFVQTIECKDNKLAVKISSQQEKNGDYLDKLSEGDDKNKEEYQEIMFVMFLVEFSMDVNRTVWINHSLAERFWAWRRHKMIERKARLESKKKAVEAESPAETPSEPSVSSIATGNTPTEHASAPEATTVESAKSIDPVPTLANDDTIPAHSYNYATSTPYDDYNSYDYSGYSYTGASGLTSSALPLVDSGNYFYPSDENAATWQGYAYDNVDINSLNGTGGFEGYDQNLYGYADPYNAASTAAAWDNYDYYAQNAADSTNAYDYVENGAQFYNYSYDPASFPMDPAYAEYSDNNTLQTASDQLGSYSGNTMASTEVNYQLDNGNALDDDYSIDLPSPQDALEAASALEEIFDPTSNQTYYFNHLTQETTWQRPA